MKYGDALPSGFHIPSSAFWLKHDLTDKNPFIDLPLPERAVVMDCGAFIGTFAAACLEQGASYVACYEAAEANAAVLEQNMKRYDVDLYDVVEAALVPDDRDAASLAMANFSGSNSIVSTAGAKQVVLVPAVNFRNQLIVLCPSVLKLDVEGAEYELMASLRPGDLASVESLFIEFHPIKDRDRDAMVTETMAMVVEAGLTIVNRRLRTFTAVRNPKVDEGLFS